MDIEQNPFYVLTASPRDNRAQIMELAQHHTLLRNSNDCMQARSDLTNPRKRLSAEIAWLPGVSVKRAKELLETLKISPAEMLDVIKLSPIARANLLAAGLFRLSDYNADDAAKWILEIARTFEKIDPEKLTALINEERIVSGFPEVTDISAVEAEIQNRRAHYRQVFKSALDKLPSMDLVKAVTSVVATATQDGQKHASILIDDLVDLYEAEAQGFLNKEAENINALIEKLRNDIINEKHSDFILEPSVDELIGIVNNWDKVAQPIQLSLKSRGLPHNESYHIALMLRNFSVEMFNEHDKLNLSQRLMDAMQKVFAEVDEIAINALKDANVLEKIDEERRALRQKDEKLREDMTYEADTSSIFTKKLRISPDGIEWEGRRWDLDSITRIRWGSTKYSSGKTEYIVVFGDNSNNVSVELKQEEIFLNFANLLWKSVGSRLMTEMLEGLRSGQKYTFGSVIVSDYGIELESKKIFGANERIFCRWDELVINSENGFFSIAKSENKNFSAALPYQDIDNIYILETAMRMLYECGKNEMSGLLKEV